VRGSGLVPAAGVDAGLAGGPEVAPDAPCCFSACGGLELSREFAADAALADESSARITSTIAAGLVALHTIPCLDTVENAEVVSFGRSS
jgi:hypothetical protein